MKKVFTFVLCTLMGLTTWLSLSGQTTTNTSRSVAPQNDTASIAGEWVLVPVLPSDTATGKIPSVYFNMTEKTFTGFTGCNQMSGRFLIQNDRLLFNRRLIVTKTICEGYNEKGFIANLLRVTSYKIEGGILLLLSGQTPLSKWMRKSSGNTL